jgi:collagen type III alpha
MAAVLEKQDTAAKNGSQVDEQIAQATSRIRAHDLTFGGLVLLALLLVYATAIICLDRYLNLPEWVRQIALAAFLGVVAATAYITLVSPMRKRINPLYAAKQVERTIDDAKNSVTGYVDAKQKADLNPTVKAALASRAAKSAAEADVNRAVDHRSLIYLGGVSVVLLLALVVLFFVFRPAQFASLMGRAFAPFTKQVLQTQTQIELQKPEPLEPTITTGQSLTVAVHIGGKVPKPDSPEKVRLLVRHNLADPNYDELPMVQGATTRDWELRVPDYLVQNGFWYKVAAGDAVTEEYKVTVRSLPMFSEFQATYEYPKYLRRKSETANNPVIHAYRGTTVTLIAKANRDVRDGLMVIEPSNTRVGGTPVPGKPDSLQFVFKVVESGKYKLTFNALNGERSADPFQSIITVDADAAPTVTITKPEDEEITEPANGQLKVDGKIGDDLGIDTVTLKMKIVSPVERPLPDMPYMNGKTTSFRREKDNTWPTDLDYKGSVDLAKLKKDAAGLALELTPDTVIEFWLEATDNCTEPKPNVGRSQPKRVRLTAPKVEEMEKQNLDKEKDARKDEEKKHDNQQQKKLDKEDRKPQKNGQQDKNNIDKKGGTGEQGDKNDEQPPKPGDKGDDPKKPDTPPMLGMGDMGNPPPKSKENPPAKKEDNTPGMPDMGMNPMPPMNPNDPNNPNNMGMGMPEAPPPKSQDDKKLDKTADDVAKELKNQDMNGGTGKPNETPKEDERTDAGQAKPQPMDGKKGMDDASQTKPEPKQGPNDPMGMGKPENAPSASKPEGDLKKPDDPSAPKPEPKKSEPMGMGAQNNAPSESRNEPIGAPAGGDKEQPKGKQPEPKDPNQKQDPNSGSGAKPDSQKKDGSDPSGMPNTDKKEPAVDAGSRAKPMPENTRGGEKPNTPQPKEPQPKEPPMGDTKPRGDSNAGEAKPDKAPPAAEPKPMPKEDMTGKGMDTEPKPTEGANDMMKPGGTGAAETKPDDGKKPPMAGGKPVEKGQDKPTPKDEKGDKGTTGDKGNNAPMPKQKLDPKQQKELDDAANDLNNPDPKKQQDARDKLDKTVGEEKRKELEKLAKDLNSPDEKTREEAKRKLEKMKQDIKDGKQPEQKGDKPKMTKEQMKEVTDALDNLQSNDAKKKEEAQKKLDKAIGEGSRKEIEQLMQDLKSEDKDKREAAQKKLEDLKEKLKKEGEDEPKGMEPSPEEIDDLLKKANDLNSPDKKTREQAEKDLDDKIGKENREKLQEEMKKKKMPDPKDIEDLKKKLEEWRQQQRGGSPEAKGAMEDDPKNRLKTAELNLIEFEKNQYNKALQAAKGWTQPEYDEFLKGYRERVEQLRKEVDKAAKTPKAPTGGPMDPATPLTGTGGGSKVDGLPGGKSGPATTSGTTAPAPGFEDARRKFEEALKEKKP